MYALNILTTRKTYMQVTLRPVCSSFISCKAILYNYLLWHWAQLYPILSSGDQHMIPVFEIYSKNNIFALNISAESYYWMYFVCILLKFHYNYLQYIVETEMTHLVGKCRWCNQNYFIPQHVLYDIYEHIWDLNVWLKDVRK